MSQSKTLFQDSRPDIIHLSDLYDPDAGTGTIIPTVGSLIIGENGAIYYVEFVHPQTKKSTLGTPRFISTEGDSDYGTSIIDYNNSRFHIFYDTRVSPTKLNIDSLLVIFGIRNSEYRLKRIDPATNKEQIISTYYDSDGTYKGDRVPLKSIEGSNGAKYCRNCHTLVSLTDNEQIDMEIFDHAGVLSATVTLFTKKAVILNDYDPTPIIVDFQITGAQIRDDAFYLYGKQDVSALMITPQITYNTGQTEQILIDDEVCFLYGTEDLISSYPGLRQTVMCKYFLRSDQLAEDAIDNGRGRFVVAEKDIIVLPNTTSFGVKISVIPIWNTGTNRYALKYFLYTTDRDGVFDVTDRVELLTDYSGSDFDREQHLTYKLDLQELFDLDEDSNHVQSTWLRLKPFHYNIERYVIKDSKDDKYAYGVDNSTYRRPVIHYDQDINKYFFPTSVFNNKEAFIESTYTRARPLYDSMNEIEPPEPTHFTIRDPETTNTIITAPIPIDEFKQAWSAIVSGEPSSTLVNKTLIVEFLYQITDTYHIIYGVPVDVHLSQTGYNL